MLSARIFPDTEMGRLCRATDWAQTSLGPVTGWPITLQAAVASVLRQGMAQSLCWGSGLVQIYNDAYCVLMGEKHPAGLGRPVLENWAEAAETVGPLIARVVGGETVFFQDLPVPVRRGGVLIDACFTFSYSPLLDDMGAVGGLLINCLETTAAVRGRRAQAERDRLTAELHLEKARLEATFQQSPSFFAILRGEKNVFEAANAAYEQIVGLGRDIIGKPLFDALPETRGQGFDAYLAQVRKTGESLVFRELPARLERKPGVFEDRFIDITYLPLREADGTHTAVIAHGTDVTEQVVARRHVEQLLADSQAARADAARAHEQLQEQAHELELANQQLQANTIELETQAEELQANSAQLQSFADAIPTLAWIARADGYIEWYNARWYEYTGTSPADMEGWGWQSVHDPAVLPSVLTEWRGAIAAGSTFEMTFPLRGADGSFRQFLTRVTPVRDSAGNVTRWFGTNTDIDAEHAARIAAEAAATRSAQLQSLTAELAAAPTLEDVAGIVVSAGQRAFGASTSTLIMADWDAGEAIIVRGVGLNATMDRRYARFPLSMDMPATTSMRQGIAVFVGTQDELLSRYPDASDFWTSQDTHAIASVPLITGGVVIGAMSFTFSHPRAFLAEETEFLVLIARQAAQAADRARLFAAERSAKNHAERARAELTTANALLQRQQREMESVNQQLQDNAIELEAQTEELQATAAQLEERTEEAEGARRTLGSIVEAVTDGFVAFDEGLRYTYVNTQASKMWRRPVEDLLGHTPFELWPEMQHSVLIPALQRVLANRKAEILEGYATSLGKPIELRAYPASGGGIVAFFTDLTERRRAEEAASFLAEASGMLASSSDYQTTLTNLAQAAVPRLGDWCAVDVLAEPDRNDWPPKIERVAVVHQDPAKVLLATSLTTKFPQDWSRATGTPEVIRSREPMYVPDVTDAMLEAGAQSLEHYDLLRALEFRSIIITPLVARDRVLGTMTLVMAESGRVFSDADLALARDLGQRAGVALDNARLLRDAAEANAAKTEFLRTISHELRQPLNAMRGYIGLWTEGLRGELSGPIRDDVERLSRNQEHLATLIEDLLSFTRLEAGRLDIERVAVPIASVFSAIEAMVRPETDARGVRFSYRLGAPDMAALGDRDRIIQIVLNLVTNALRATPASGRVSMHCLEETSHLIIEVADTGRGIPADKLESVFSPFVQVGRALNAPKEGAGLGLAISRGLAEAMHGTLTVKSVEGVGSTFSLTLPRALPTV